MAAVDAAAETASVTARAEANSKAVDDKLAALLGRRVSIWWPRLRTFLYGTLTDYRQDLRCFTCAYDGSMGVDRFLMVHEYSEGESTDTAAGLVTVADHYLLDFPEDWKPSHPDNQHRVAMLGAPLGLAQCGCCEGCKLLEVQHHEDITQPQPCHSVRAGILAHYGHYGSQLSFSGASAVGRRISKHCAARKSFHEGFVTDWNPVTWRHQVLYDDGGVEDCLLYQDRLRKPGGSSWVEMEPSHLVWLPPGQDVHHFCGQGRFKSREMAESAVGRRVYVYSELAAGQRGWRPAYLTAYVEGSQAHAVTYADGQSPATGVVDYNREVVMLLSNGVSAGLSNVDGGAAEPDRQARTLYREARLHEDPVPTPKRMKPDSPAEPGCSSMGGDAGASRAGGGPPGATASGSGRRVGSDNPLMQSQASYIQIMGWVSEFLRHDTRVPPDAQKLMAIHEQVQQNQVHMGLHQAEPEKFFGHTFTAMGMTPQAWHHESAATAALMSAPAAQRAGFQCSQGLINTLFLQQGAPHGVGPASTIPPAAGAGPATTAAEEPIKEEPADSAKPPQSEDAVPHCSAS